jgi:hypothetical protein
VITGRTGQAFVDGARATPDSWSRSYAWDTQKGAQNAEEGETSHDLVLKAVANVTTPGLDRRLNLESSLSTRTRTNTTTT